MHETWAPWYTGHAPTNATIGIGNSIAGKTHLDDVKRIYEVVLPHLDAGEEAVVMCHSYGGHLENSIDRRADRGGACCARAAGSSALCRFYRLAAAIAQLVRSARIRDPAGIDKT
ncbi:Uu.00g138650.m01.CDS01 [Anthostomella pinea]|uniref:Uu.00g138650.m01.CDS01 n=1 Tax=Anthostomella pinea TaxID=933095 RepID=A0AAI8YL86_9PEZI|nr:Uu.00g138650.m01.CDS01 [Anthostomella pinea]